LLAEDSVILPFAGSPQHPEWLSPEEASTFLALEPEQNIAADVAANFIRSIVNDFHDLTAHLEKVAHRRGKELLVAHQRVRAATRQRNVSHRVEPSLPPDVLGIYLYLPAAE
jgi:hypothetical protein